VTLEFIALPARHSLIVYNITVTVHVIFDKIGFKKDIVIFICKFNSSSYLLIIIRELLSKPQSNINLCAVLQVYTILDHTTF